MISFDTILGDRTKRYLLVYSRHVYAVRQMHVFYDLVKDLGATLYESGRTIRFREGGFARFDHIDQEFKGLEIDDYMVDESIAKRMDSLPLMTLLATRKRSRPISGKS